MPDRTHYEMNRRIAEFMGWVDISARLGNYQWKSIHGEFVIDAPNYCSDDSPRSLLTGVEQKLPDKWRKSYTSKLLGLNRGLSSRNGERFYLATVSAEARCRAICAVLDELQIPEVQP